MLTNDTVKCMLICTWPGTGSYNHLLISLFTDRLMNERESRTEAYTVEVSLAEIYVNEVRDLLAIRCGQVEKVGILPHRPF